MKYMILTMVVIFLIGCGSNAAVKSGDVNTAPKSPQVKDVKNIPPSVPKI